MAKIFKSDDENMQLLNGKKILLVQEIPGESSAVEITVEGMNAKFVAFLDEIQDVD